MQPIQIVIRDMPNSPAIESHIRKKAEKLNPYFDRINSCRVVVDIPQKHKRQGKLFSVSIDMTVPGKELIVNHKLDEDVYVAIRDAFNALLRQLETYTRRRRGDVKTHEHADVSGHIAKLFFDEAYGFIDGIDGNEYYFSPTNVVHPAFDQLNIGDSVHFIPTPADDGLQAHHVTKHKEPNGSL